MKNLIALFLILLLIPMLSFSQTNIDSLIIQGKQQLHQATNRWTDADLLQARAYFERLLMDGSKSWLVHYYIGLVDYRLVSYYFSKQDKDQAKQFINDGIEHLLATIDSNKNFSDAHSLLSSLYGNKIGMNPLLGMTLGPKSGKEMGKAIELDPKNPRNYLIAGWSAYFTPKMFGGGKGKAKNYFEQAIAYFDSFKVTDPLLPDWGQDEAYAWLGVAQMENEEFEASKINFNKALEINSAYGWVNHVLLPQLNTKMENKQ